MIPTRLIPRLAAAANNEINKVLASGAPSFKQKKPTGEVGFVAAVLLGGVPAIASAWRPILKPAGYSVTMSGILCHQTPRVKFTDAAGKQKTCELADLLIVVDDLTTGSLGQRWAVLIQAKMASSSGGQRLSKQGDLTQLDLLSRWPCFTMPSTFAPGARDFSACRHPGVLTDCGRYGLIINSQPSPVWNQQAPAISMPAGGDELGTFLAHMIEAGQNSYGREATGLTDDWSMTVDELMRVTASKAFNYAAGFRGAQPRRSTGMAFVLTPAYWFPYDLGLVAPPHWGWADQIPPSGGRTELPKEEGSDGGISILRIGVVSDKG